MSEDRAQWLHEAGWGVGLHYVAATAWQLREGDVSMPTREQWDRQVEAVDVEQLAGTLAATSAGYVLFTVGQSTGHFCSPNDTYERIVGSEVSKCSRRDLIADLAEAVKARGMRMIAYVPSHAPSFDRPAVEGARLHVFSFLGSKWRRGDRPRFRDDLARAYTRHVLDHGGAVTWDVPIDDGGRIPERFVDQLHAIGREATATCRTAADIGTEVPMPGERLASDAAKQ